MFCKEIISDFYIAVLQSLVPIILFMANIILSNMINSLVGAMP